MVDTELKTEFNQLIQEVSKEVLELSVSKSMVEAAYTVKEQVPTMTANISELKLALEALKSINTDFVMHKQELIKHESRVEHQIKEVGKQIDTDISLMKEVKEDISSIWIETERKFDKQSDYLTYISNQNLKQAKANETQINELTELTKEGVGMGLTTKKLLIWTLVFSLGSFGILTTLLLNTLKVISL